MCGIPGHGAHWRERFSVMFPSRWRGIYGATPCPFSLGGRLFSVTSGCRIKGWMCLIPPLLTGCVGSARLFLCSVDLKIGLLSVSNSGAQLNFFTFIHLLWVCLCVCTCAFSSAQTDI